MAGIKKISLYTAIGNFVGNTGINNVNDIIDDLARWIEEAEIKIGSRRSFERIECELEVENYRACLPKGFVFLNGIKHGNEYLEVTKKSFRLFNKGGSSFYNESLNDTKYNGGNLVLNTPGAPLIINVNFTGIFIESEVITLSIFSNNCGDVISDVFSYIVQAGDTTETIILAIANQIDNYGNLPYKATATPTYLQIEGIDANVHFVITPYTNSASGQVVCSVYQNRVAPKQRSTTNELEQNAIKLTSPNLANKDAAPLNTGVAADRYLTSGNIGRSSTYGYYGDFGSVSKFSIENGYVYFNHVQDGRVGISYMGLLFDENGWPMVEESHADAISAYLIHMWTKRKFIMGKISGQVYQEMKQEWQWKCGQARGEDELPDQTELMYLANIWNQLLPTPNLNYF
jgi:hypothetical protein